MMGIAVMLVLLQLFLVFGREDRSGAATDLADRDIIDEHGGLEDIQADDLLHQIAARNDGVKADHHQDGENPIVKTLYDELKDIHGAYQSSSRISGSRPAKW